ncbi:MAG: Periplasmic aromatic aldehyde oxidoreductase, molybdenum binding subunit YagR [uncultured Caballeronia sp.]|nr:MAG: Periplasmic aromatic aldehyde oxidoreductase, molybdenum binding subunit YagR [uncultured Caballeronia sp.]
MQYVRPCFVRLAAIEKLQPPMRPISLFLCPRVLTQSGTCADRARCRDSLRLNRPWMSSVSGWGSIRWSCVSGTNRVGLPFSSCYLVECLRTGADKFGWAQRTLGIGSMKRDGLTLGWG